MRAPEPCYGLDSSSNVAGWPVSESPFQTRKESERLGKAEYNLQGRGTVTPQSESPSRMIGSVSRLGRVRGSDGCVTRMVA